MKFVYMILALETEYQLSNIVEALIVSLIFKRQPMSPIPKPLNNKNPIKGKKLIKEFLFFLIFLLWKINCY